MKNKSSLTKMLSGQLVGKQAAIRVLGYKVASQDQQLVYVVIEARKCRLAKLAVG